MKISTTLAASLLCITAGVASADIAVNDPRFPTPAIPTAAVTVENAMEHVEAARFLNGPGPSFIQLYADGQPAVFVTAASWDEIASVLSGLPEFKDRFGSAIPVTDSGTAVPFTYP